MAYARPVPVIGDATSARQRSADPRAWALAQADRDALAKVVGARRDIRRFRPDPVDEPTLERLLAAAHAAPSVGHSQPWRFIVVSEPELRERAAVLADRERVTQAAQLDPESARHLLDLQLEGIREAPLGVVVCCDRRTPAAGVLGRATYPDADMWSCACAIQNLWLTARAEGLGVGWVTLFRPDELAQLLRLPDGVETLGWLCVGWPDERPPAPGLERAGWSRRAPLGDHVLRERWHDDDVASPVSRLRAPDQRAVVTARDEADQVLAPPNSLGVLDRALDRITALPRPNLDSGALVLVGADHPVTEHGVSAYPSSVTAEVMRAAVAGEAAGVIAALSTGLSCRVVDAGVGTNAIDGALDLRPAGARGDLRNADAMTVDDVTALLGHGREVGRAGAAQGVVALGEVGVGNTTIAAILAAALLNRPADELIGLGAGSDSAMVEHKRAVARETIDRVDLTRDPVITLAQLGGPEIVVLAGVTLGAASAGVPVVLDGLATTVAAAFAVELEPAVAAHLVAGQRSREPAHQAVLQHLGLEPLVDLRIRAGEGVGACLAVGLLQHAARVRRLTGRTDS